jgi:tRNA(Ile)-lysidine synthase
MDRLRPGWAGELGVVAVSGGADSVALLRALVEIEAKVVVGHVNHLLRGDESDGDERFVVQLGEVLNVPVRSVRLTMPDGNLESEARRVRYEWLTQLADELGAGWVATGHTADDQAETVLHRLIRGAGLHGLRGIAAARFPSPPAGEGLGVRGTILRPLLSLPRTDLLDYLSALNQPFRTDSTNANTAFTRNRIRAELLPLLRTFNPAIVDVLGRVSRQAEEMVRFFDAQALALLQTAQLPDAGYVFVFAAEPLEAAHPVLVKAMFRLFWDLAALPANGMTADHWNRLLAIALGDHPAADFPDGVHVRRIGKVVQLGRVR